MMVKTEVIVLEWNLGIYSDMATSRSLPLERLVTLLVTGRDIRGKLTLRCHHTKFIILDSVWIGKYNIHH